MAAALASVTFAVELETDHRSIGDRTWPEDHCCRFYKGDKFNTGEDFCLVDG